MNSNRYFTGALLALTAMAAAVAPASAQTSTATLGRAPWSYMHTLLQKTILKVDVLTVDICFDAPTARRFAALAGRGRITGAVADSVARAALLGQRAVARIEFRRDVSLGQFLDGVDQDQAKAVAAGLLADTTYRALSAELPGVYAFLEKRGIRDGDQILYELAHDSIRVVFRGREGRTLLDSRDAGRERRNSPLATWLAPGSDFREELLESLQRDGARAATRPFADRCRLRPTAAGSE